VSATQPNISQFDRAYFIGIGGIGMSAIARYFHQKGWQVAGYDKTRTALTTQLENEGIAVHYEDLGAMLPEGYGDREKTMVVYTPAIPKDMGELVHVQQSGYPVFKRAQVLGMITRDSIGLCVAGTHGKTTTSTLLAWILDQAPQKCNAFLGGISSNFESNFVSHPESPYTVIEADEFDRSFLQLSPQISIVTSTDADHLDIYGDNAHFLEGFQAYAERLPKNGLLIHHVHVHLEAPHKISYGIDCDADYVATDLRYTNQRFLFDLTFPDGTLKNLELGIPGIHNTENAIACIALAHALGLNEETIRRALASFKGVKRRFEYRVQKPELVYIDDYAHHPTEIQAFISSVRLLYPNQRVTGVFQPHLFTRTRDFFDGFVHTLSQLDEVILLPIYPARELPLPGITSEALCEKIQGPPARVRAHEEAVRELSDRTEGIILTIGAGDIDLIVEPLTLALA
jgi:UDP-N-acetylmuramate--alanine ligase